MNPALDLVNFLDTRLAGAVTLAKGVNLFTGRMISTDDSPSPAVFALNTGGPPPELLLGGHRTAIYRATVQVMIRGPMADQLAGEELARGVYAWLQQQTIVGYLQVLARDSAPAYLGEDQGPHHLWAINVECQYQASLS